MDAANSYGTHLLYPFSSRWIYGDAVFVLEPWVWLIAGLALVLNAARWRWRVVALLTTVVPILALAIGGLITLGVLATMVAGGRLMTMVMRPWSRRKRAATAVAGIAIVFIFMFGMSRAASNTARRLVPAAGTGRLVELVLNPNPAAPWCWMVIALEHDAEEAGDRLIARRGTLSLLPRLMPPASCASSRLAARADVSGDRASGGLVWHQEWRIDLTRLRAIYAGDCRVRAWLQFARVPYVGDGRIEDLRFAEPFGGGFGSMAIDPAPTDCPGYLTNWEPPRRDVLSGQADP